ncbi:MAG TPA: adenylate/guanylate cyclase domain-containing protein [Myxococcota bacterium]|nr:adenylate/guanylate cyclase domain-containing protein [Myxococcota bacterium]
MTQARISGRGLSLGAAALAIGAAVAAAVWALRAAGLLQGAELAAYDAFSAWRAAPPSAPAQVALVRIREEEIAKYGHPLPDAILARALERIEAAGPRAIGVDLYRVAPAADAPREGWDALARAAADPRVVLLEKRPEGTEPGVPAPAFAAPDQIGFSDLPVDADGVVRRALLYLWDDAGLPATSLPLQLALRFLQADGVALAADPAEPEHVRLGVASLPPFEPDDGAYVGADAGGYQLLLDWRRAPESFPFFSLEDVIAGGTPDDAFAGRAVIVGTSAPSVKDSFLTAHSGGRAIEGIEVHAHAVDQLLRLAQGAAAPTRFPGGLGEAAWLLAWSVGGALLARWMRAPLALVGLSLLLLASLYGVGYALFRAGFWLPVVPPALAAAGSAGLVVAEAMRRERAERAVVMDLFGRFVSRGVARELWDRRAEFMDGGRPRPQRLVVTAMLTDLKGYTSAAEKMDPTELMAWVNEYMDAMTQVIEAHGGFVDDYSGDGIKANFGVPFAHATPGQVTQDARAAVRCALAMGRELERLCSRWRAEGRPDAMMRIGLHTGEVIAGSIGSARRMKYTTVGDTVNTAARIESFAKDEFEAEVARGASARFRVLVSEATHEQLGDGFACEPLGAHVLRGRGAALGLYRVREERALATPEARA